LASKQGYSATLGWKDVAGNLVAFEAINGVRLEVRISTADYRGLADLTIVAIAHSRKAEIGDLPPLASVTLSILGSRLVSLEGALIHALYMLDGQLAERELSAEENGA